MRLFLTPFDKMQCPHCGYTYSERAGTFPIPFKMGDESQALYECEQCEAEFFATRDNVGRVTVRML